jgi:uncharacterized protein (TIGR03067 family)
MTRLALAALLAVTATAPAAPVPKGIKSKVWDADAILGTWRMYDHAVDGSHSDSSDVCWRFEPNGKLYCVHTKTGREFPMGYALDPTGDPKRMEWRSSPNEKPSPAIYKLDGDTLFVVHPTGDGPRPTEIAAGKGLYYTEFHREKAK